MSFFLYLALFVLFVCVAIKSEGPRSISVMPIGLAVSCRPLQSLKLIHEAEGIPFSRHHVLNKRPLFYGEQMPLKFTVNGKELKMGKDRTNRVVFEHDFGDWINHFIFYRSEDMFCDRPKGVVAINSKTKKVIGECVIKHDLIKDDRFVIVEEHHFDDEERRIFVGFFKLDLKKGIKVEEFKTKGKKEKEYFFFWNREGAL